eukprot:5407013-Amphidinium_carterae.1
MHIAMFKVLAIYVGDLGVPEKCTPSVETPYTFCNNCKNKGERRLDRTIHDVLAHSGKPHRLVGRIYYLRSVADAHVCMLQNTLFELMRALRAEL